ncbi:hypothetical protein [Brevundimonas sp.]|uniref:hypothetical protein n=1 Tax=Brevundimonas sp. TaxID=1871086 RepID=UPI0028A18124|nr:hypothetical protein [Brevundimonas sp.]
MPITGPEADRRWTARTIVADGKLSATLTCRCGARPFDMWTIHHRQRDDDLEHIPFRCTRCKTRASALVIQRWNVGRFEHAATITYISWEDKHAPGRRRPDGSSSAFSNVG